MWQWEKNGISPRESMCKLNRTPDLMGIFWNFSWEFDDFFQLSDLYWFLICFWIWCLLWCSLHNMCFTEYSTQDRITKNFNSKNVSVHLVCLCRRFELYSGTENSHTSYLWGTLLLLNVCIIAKTQENEEYSRRHFTHEQLKESRLTTDSHGNLTQNAIGLGKYH